MSRFYFCKTIGDGSEESPIRPAISNYTTNYIAVDGVMMMVECKNITESQHTKAISDTNIIYFDINNIDLDDQIKLIPDRALLISQLTAQDIDVSMLNSDNTLRQVLQYVVKSLIQKQNPSVLIKKTHYDS